MISPVEIQTGTVIRAVVDNPNVYTQQSPSSALAKAYVVEPTTSADRVYRQWLRGEVIGLINGAAKAAPDGTLLYPVLIESWEWQTRFPIGNYRSVKYEYWVVVDQERVQWVRQEWYDLASDVEDNKQIWAEVQAELDRTETPMPIKIESATNPSTKKADWLLTWENGQSAYWSDYKPLDTANRLYKATGKTALINTGKDAGSNGDGGNDNTGFFSTTNIILIALGVFAMGLVLFLTLRKRN